LECALAQARIVWVWREYKSQAGNKVEHGEVVSKKFAYHCFKAMIAGDRDELLHKLIA
jgi:hypothetical protein